MDLYYSTANCHRFASELVSFFQPLHPNSHFQTVFFLVPVQAAMSFRLFFSLFIFFAGGVREGEEDFSHFSSRTSPRHRAQNSVHCQFLFAFANFPRYHN